MTKQTIELDGKRYVVVPEEDYKFTAKAVRLPPLPDPLPDGNYPAIDYARATLARNIVRDRIKAGLSQAERPKRAGIRVETLCRIETAKVTPTAASIDKIDRALTAAKTQTGQSARRAAKS